MVIVDTSVWIDYIVGTVNFETEWLDRHMSGHGVALTDFILCEVLQGFREETAFQTVYKQLVKLPVLDSGGTKIAIASAQNYRSLRSAGVTIRKTIDCIIATFCIVNGHSLLHRDRDFHPFEKQLGLNVIHPLGT